MSLDAPVDRSEGKPLHPVDLLTDDQERADEALARNQLVSLLQDQLPHFRKLLNDKECRILNDRLLAEEPKTLQEVADLYGLTRERARQIEAKVIEKLRNFLRPSLFPDS
jgi:RNA polymerase sigma-32 factor